MGTKYKLDQLPESAIIAVLLSEATGSLRGLLRSIWPVRLFQCHAKQSLDQSELTLR